MTRLEELGLRYKPLWHLDMTIKGLKLWWKRTSVYYLTGTKFGKHSYCISPQNGQRQFYMKCDCGHINTLNEVFFSMLGRSKFAAHQCLKCRAKQDRQFDEVRDMLVAEKTPEHIEQIRQERKANRERVDKLMKEMGPGKVTNEELEAALNSWLKGYSSNDWGG